MHSIKQIRRAMDKKGYVFFSGEYDINIIGVRMDRSFESQNLNLYTDWIYIIWETFGITNILPMRATTLSGEKYLQHYSNPKGLGIIVPGQYRSVWEIGKHKGRDALTQCGTFKVARDNNGNRQFDFINLENARHWCGFNFHDARSSRNPKKVELKYIGSFSEGCQVCPNVPIYRAAFKIIKFASEIYGPRFSYTLLEEKDIII